MSFLTLDSPTACHIKLLEHGNIFCYRVPAKGTTFIHAKKRRGICRIFEKSDKVKRETENPTLSFRACRVPSFTLRKAVIWNAVALASATVKKSLPRAS